MSECAVVELKDPIKGDVPFGFIIKNKSIYKYYKFIFYKHKIKQMLFGNFTKIQRPTKKS